MAQHPSPSLDAAFQRAVQHHRAGELGRAEALYDEVLKSAPEHWDALQLLGVLNAQTGRLDRAVELLSRAVALNPNQPMLHSQLARALFERGRFDEALASCDRALAVDPGFLGILETRAVILSRLGRHQEACDCARRLLAAQPRNLTGHMVLTSALLRLGRLEEALAGYEAALRLAPDNPDLNLQYGLTLLKLGRYAEGFRRHEHRFRSSGAPPAKAYASPKWLGGASLAGKSLFIPSEFFAGDIIQFVRYAPIAEGFGARVALGTPRRLHRLLGALSPTLSLLDEDDDGAGFDYHCPLLSLPLAFGTTLDTIPGRTPYLRAEPEKVAVWRERLGGPGFKVGVSWQGSTRKYGQSVERSFPLSTLRPLAGVPSVRLVSLQKFEGAEQLDRAPADLKIERLGDEADSGPDGFVDTAAIMQDLDLVISCDTAIAHLAGALARPVWVALPHESDWRWLAGRDDSPWYPTMRLFAQASPGAWGEVFASMARELAPLAAVGQR